MVTGISYNMSRVDLRRFRTVAFDYGKIHMRGCALAKPAPVDSGVITLTENRKITFVRMATKEQWLVAAVTGERKLTRLFVRTTLLDDLRLKILQYCNGSTTDGTPEGAVRHWRNQKQAPRATRTTTIGAARTPLKRDEDLAVRWSRQAWNYACMI